eukprot:3174088-Amphidinium_carterae.1
MGNAQAHSHPVLLFHAICLWCGGAGEVHPANSRQDAAGLEGGLGSQLATPQCPLQLPDL